MPLPILAIVLTSIPNRNIWTEPVTVDLIWRGIPTGRDSPNIHIMGLYAEDAAEYLQIILKKFICVISENTSDSTVAGLGSVKKPGKLNYQTKFSIIFFFITIHL